MLKIKPSQWFNYVGIPVTIIACVAFFVTGNEGYGMIGAGIGGWLGGSYLTLEAVYKKVYGKNPTSSEVDKGLDKLFGKQ